MDRFEHAAVLTNLIDAMRNAGSWCGETHIQKGTYFLQELLEVPLEFRFILYKHGPFAFDLRDALTTMRSDHFIDVDIQPYPYGPRIVPTDTGRAFGNNYEDLVERYRARIDFVANQLRDSKVANLERYATALFVSQASKGHTERERANEICKLKPHVDFEEAMLAVRFVNQMSTSAADLLSGSDA